MINSTAPMPELTAATSLENLLAELDAQLPKIHVSLPTLSTPTPELFDSLTAAW